MGATGAITVVVILSIWHPAGWAAAAAYTFGGGIGGVAGSKAHSKWDAEGNKASGKKGKVQERKFSSQIVCPLSNSVITLHIRVDLHNPHQSFLNYEAQINNSFAVNLAIKGVDDCANQARQAIAMMFCGQVMQKRLDENLPEHDRRAILATLGVDVDAVSDSVYRQELIRDRVRQLREKNRNLCNMMERVLEDANVEPETTEQAM